MADLEVRVSVLETEISNMEETLKKLDSRLEDNHNLTYDIKSRLDKQNGLIPHMSEDIKTLLTHHESLKENQLKVGLRVKILWGIVIALGSSITGLLFSLLKDFLHK